MQTSKKKENIVLARKLKRAFRWLAASTKKEMAGRSTSAKTEKIPEPEKAETQPKPDTTEPQPMPDKTEKQPKPDKIEKQTKSDKTEKHPKPKMTEKHPKPMKKTNAPAKPDITDFKLVGPFSVKHRSTPEAQRQAYILDSGGDNKKKRFIISISAKQSADYMWHICLAKDRMADCTILTKFEAIRFAQDMTAQDI